MADVVLYLHTSAGGHVHYVLALANPLSELADCVVVTSRGVDHNTRAKVVEGITPIDVEASGARRVIDRLSAYSRHPRELEAALRAERSEGRGNVCHLQELPTVLPGRMVRAVHRAGFRCVLTVHNVTPHEPRRLDSLERRTLTAAYRSADRILVHSEALKASLVRAAGLAPNHVGVVPHPVWPASPMDAPLDAPMCTYLFFGQLRTNKGVDLFVDALAQLGDPPATIRGAGSASMVAHISHRIRELKLNNCDFRPGFVPDGNIPGLFARHDVLVAPYTHFAAQSGVTHLAVTYRTASVVTDVGALGDLVREYGVGELADQVSVASVADSMDRAMQMVAQGAYAQALERAAQDLAPERVARLLLDEYAKATLLGMP